MCVLCVLETRKKMKKYCLIPPRGSERNAVTDVVCRFLCSWRKIDVLAIRFRQRVDLENTS